MKILPLIILFVTSSCAIETVNLKNEGDIATEEASEEVEEVVEEPEDKPTVVIEEDSGETSQKTLKKRRRVVNKFEIAHLNHTKFVSPNYCRGQKISDCWIKSGLLTEYADGRINLSMEFEDTYEDKPYKVTAEDIVDGQAILVSEQVRVESDDSFEDKYLWVVVDLENYTLEVVYDWDKDGPQEQGDDELNTLEFVDIGL